MSAASCLLTEDQFLCSICLDVFTDPVSIPCGHNFCKPCITENWNINVQCQCPNCNKQYSTRPELQINTFISEMAAQFRQSAQQKTNVCLYVLCTISDHKTHDVVPVKEEYDIKKAELQKTEAEVHQMIQKRRLKIEEIKASVQLSKKDADREIAEGVQVFTALKESVERGQAELIKTIKEKQRTTEKQAEDFIKELEQEISDLNKRSSEVEQLSQSEDHLHLLQMHSSLNTAGKCTKNWTEVSICPPVYEGTVSSVVAQLKKTLSKEMKKVLEAELKRVQQFAVDVTLDPDVVYPIPDGQQINKSYDCRCVLSNQGYASGKLYFEVQVKKWSTWTLGVARELIVNVEKELSPNIGYWTICLKHPDGCYAAADPPVHLYLKSHPEKVGVFVDYEEGLVSFYDADTAAPIYSFTGCSFTETLYPFFSPCSNDRIKGWKNSFKKHKLYFP
uniref:Uncharacterized protein n=1 Tax=Anabas testudineus TaxID=64144 RepID=A0A3Q1HYX4_ANATE